MNASHLSNRVERDYGEIKMKRDKTDMRKCR